MTRTAIKWTTLAMFSMAVLTAPFSSAFAAGSDTPSAPPASDKDKKKGADSGSRLQDTAFLENYRAAYATVYDKQDYPAAIAQLKALGQDDRADVANLIGYSYRKLGDYKLAQVYYERALKADPGHVRTWQYYGLWQVERGNRDQAQYHLTRIGALAGSGSPEYKSLASALSGSATAY